MKKAITIILFMISIICFEQQSDELTIVKYNDVYIEDNLIYLESNENLYSGLIHHKRKNDHLVKEELIKNGIIVYTILYYNRRQTNI